MKVEDNLESKKHFQHLGGELFEVCIEPSDTAVLWGELFSEHERKLFRKNLQEAKALICINDTYEIYLRVLWRPESLMMKGNKRNGKFVLFLHEIRTPLTTSWTFAKIAMPMYRAGFSVLMLDWPGLGKSKMNQAAKLPPERWMASDWHIISETLDELKVPRVSTVSSGESCASIIRLLQRAPHQVGGEHVFRDPILPVDDMFKVSMNPSEAFFMREHFYEKKKTQQAALFGKVLRTAAARVWALITPTYDNPDVLDLLDRVSATQIMRHDVNPSAQPESSMPAAVTDVFDTQAGTARLYDCVTVTPIHDEDMKDVQIGASLPGVRFLFPSSNLKTAISHFLSDTGVYSDPKNFKAHKRPHASAHARMAHPALTPSASLPSLQQSRPPFASLRAEESPQGSRPSSVSKPRPTTAQSLSSQTTRPPSASAYSSSSSWTYPPTTAQQEHYLSLSRPSSAAVENQTQSQAILSLRSLPSDVTPSPPIDSTPILGLRSSGVAPQRKRENYTVRICGETQEEIMYQREDDLATTMQEAVIKAHRLRTDGNSGLTHKEYLLTLKQKGQRFEKQVNRNIDKDVTAEEEEIIESVIAESMKTFEADKLEKQAAKDRFRRMEENTQGAKSRGLSRGVLHYLRMAFQAKEKNRAHEAHINQSLGMPKSLA